MRLAFVTLLIVAGTTEVIADARTNAFECMNRAAASYALASCEPASTIVTAAKAACGKEISELTHAVVNDSRYQALSLEWRLEHSDNLVFAREGAMTAIILEARMRAGRVCN